MPDATRTTTRPTPALEVPKFIEEMEQANYDRREEISHDGWTEGGTTFAVTVCSARRGVPVTMKMRVVANTMALARVRTKTLMEAFSEGTELLSGASYTRSGESCRVYLDPTLLRGRLTCTDEGPAGPRPPRPPRLSPDDLFIEMLMRRGALDAERAETLSRLMSGGAEDPDRIDRADRDSGDWSIFNVEASSMRVGVPVGINVRVVAEDKVEAYARAQHLLRRLSEGTELLEGADFTRPGESCRVFTDPAFMASRVPIVDEGAGWE